MRILIVGGSSGLGLEIAKLFAPKNEVIVTGRKNPQVKFATFKKFDLSQPDLAAAVKSFVQKLPQINVLVYAAGYYQEGTLTDLTDKQIEEMLNVGGRGLIYFAKYLLDKQGKLDELITITSTSQWTPRKLEPIYNFIKAGGGHLSNGLAEDGRIKKVLVAGPAGMRTAFWDGIKRDDLDEMLDPAWVAEQIAAAGPGEYRYKFIKIMRQPARVEEVEKR